MPPEIRRVLDLFAAVSANPNTPVGAALLRDFRHALIEALNEAVYTADYAQSEYDRLIAEVQNYGPTKEAPND